MNALRAWTARLLLLAGVLQAAGCNGPVWPSRGMTVQTSGGGPSALEVKNVVADELKGQGFVGIGEDGRDAMTNQRASFDFEGPHDVVVSVGVDAVNEVLIRVNQNRETFTPEATQVFERIAVALEARWGNRVMQEPKPTK